MLIRRTLPLLLALAALALPAPAAARPADVVRDCNRDGDLDRRFSARDLAGALRSLPSDVSEYGECRAQIARQQRLYAPIRAGRRFARPRVQCFWSRPVRVSLLNHGRSLGTRRFRCRAGRQLAPNVRLTPVGSRLATRRGRRVRVVIAVGRGVDGYPVAFGR